MNLERLRTGFWRFWLEPCSNAPLVALRIGISSLAILQLALLWPFLDEFYGNRGLIQWIFIEALDGGASLSIGKLALVLSKFGVRSTTVVHGVFVVYGLALFAMLFGYRTRLFAFVATAAHTLTVGSGYNSMYGVDTMLHLSLFYMCFFPSTGTVHSTSSRIALRVLQLHVVLIYLNTGIAKGLEANWWNGEAVWLAIMQPRFSTMDMTFLAEVPWLAQAAGIFTVIVEAGLPIALFFKRLRSPWLLAIVGLHVQIALLMGLHLFSATMIVLDLCAFGLYLEEDYGPWLRRLLARRRWVAASTLLMGRRDVSREKCT